MEKRSDGFLLWTLLKWKLTFPSANQIAWNVYKDEEDITVRHLQITQNQIKVHMQVIWTSA